MSETASPPSPARKRNWPLIAAIVSMGFVVCVLAVYFGMMWRVSEAMKPTIIERDEPFSLGEVRRMSGLPIPDSAKNIRYAGYSEFQAFIEVLCFEAPVEDCKTFAEKVVTDHNRKKPNGPLPGLRSITPSDRAAVGDLIFASNLLKPLKVPWFSPASVRSGMVAGESGSHQPMIWIDLEKGVLYYLLTD